MLGVSISRVLSVTACGIMGRRPRRLVLKRRVVKDKFENLNLRTSSNIESWNWTWASAQCRRQGSFATGLVVFVELCVTVIYCRLTLATYNLYHHLASLILPPYFGRENMLCLDLEKTPFHPLGHRVRPKYVKARGRIYSIRICSPFTSHTWKDFCWFHPYLLSVPDYCNSQLLFGEENVYIVHCQEAFYFRFLGGPQNRLTWALDPEDGDAGDPLEQICSWILHMDPWFIAQSQLHVWTFWIEQANQPGTPETKTKARKAIWRLRRCVVGLQMEHSQGFKEVLGHYFPWLHEVKDIQNGS